MASLTCDMCLESVQGSFQPRVCLPIYTFYRHQLNGSVDIVEYFIKDPISYFPVVAKRT